jgi:hypothetical protein
MGAGGGDDDDVGCTLMCGMVVLPLVLVVDCVCLVLRECEGTRELKSKRVSKKPVLRLVTLAQLDQ